MPEQTAEITRGSNRKFGAFNAHGGCSSDLASHRDGQANLLPDLLIHSAFHDVTQYVMVLYLSNGS